MSDRVTMNPYVSDVVEAHVVAAARQRARLAAQHEVLRGADAGPERDPLVHEVR